MELRGAIRKESWILVTPDTIGVIPPVGFVAFVPLPLMFPVLSVSSLALCVCCSVASAAALRPKTLDDPAWRWSFAFFVVTEPVVVRGAAAAIVVSVVVDSTIPAVPVMTRKTRKTLERMDNNRGLCRNNAGLMVKSLSRLCRQSRDGVYVCVNAALSPPLLFSSPFFRRSLLCWFRLSLSLVLSHSGFLLFSFVASLRLGDCVTIGFDVMRCLISPRFLPTINSVLVGLCAFALLCALFLCFCCARQRRSRLVS